MVVTEKRLHKNAEVGMGLIDRRLCHALLKKWANAPELGRSQFAQHVLVVQQHRQHNYADSEIGWGFAVRDVLSESIEHLKPVEEVPDYQESNWRPYLILTERFVQGRRPDYIADTIGVARSTYNRAQAEAINLLVGDINERTLLLEQKKPAVNQVAQKQPQPWGAATIPPPLTSPLVGRHRLLATLKERLLQTQGAIIALYGLPGVGKSTLATALAHDPQVLACFPDGVLWIGLSQQSDLLSLLSQWGATLGLAVEDGSTPSTVAEWAFLIHQAIGQRRFLLVIDNVWRVEDVLAFKLGGFGCAHLLITRLPEVALTVAGENSFHVQEFSLSDGLHYLQQQLPSDLMATQLEQVMELVRLTGGLPLALKLISSYLRKEMYGGQKRRIQAAIDGLIESADSRLQLGQPQSIPEQHPDLPFHEPLSLASVIQMSVMLIVEPARLALWRLSVFPPKPNTFAEEAAIAVTGSSVEMLDILMDSGLLESGGNGRYTIHQAIADYAESKLEDETARQRFVSFYSHYVAQHKEEHHLLERESTNILAALDTSYTQQQWPDLIALSNNIYHFLWKRGLRSLLTHYLERAREAAEQIGDTNQQATTLAYLGQLATQAAKFDKAKILLEEGLGLLKPPYPLATKSILLRILGVVYNRQGDGEKAQKYWLEALQLAYGAEEPTLIIMTLHNLGVTHVYLGNVEQCLIWYHEALALAEAEESQWLMSTILNNLGILYANNGEFEQANACYEKGLTMARTTNHRINLCHLQNNLGYLRVEQGAYEEARVYLENSLTLSQEMQRERNICIALTSLAELALAEGDYETAVFQATAAQQLAEKVGYHAKHIETLALLGNIAIYHPDTDYAVAEMYLQQAITLSSQLKYHVDKLKICLFQGNLRLKEKKFDEARHFFAQLLETTHKKSHWVALAQFGLAQVADAQGKTTEAQEHGYQSWQQLQAMGHRQATVVRAWLER